MKNYSLLYPKVVKFYMLLALAACWGCSSRNESVNFDKKISLTTETEQDASSSDSAFMRYPHQVRLNGSVLHVTDLHATDAYCHEFSYPGLKYHRSYAYKGAAPDNFLSVSSIRTTDNNEVILIDARKNIIAYIDPENNEIKKEIQLSREPLYNLDFVMLSDSLIAVPDYSGNSRICIMNKDGEIVEKLFNIPVDKNEKTSGVPLAQAWRAFIDYNPENGILAAVTQLGEVLEIYNMRDNSVVNIVIGKHGKPQFMTKEGYSVPIGIMGYSDVQVTSDKIYAIFWGTSFKDIKAGKINKEGGNQIHVYDLKGNPVCLYELDRHVTGFRIDENQKKMVALDVNSDNPIVIYQL